MEKALREEAIASKGKFSEKLLNKYPHYAEAYVRDYVKNAEAVFPPDFEKWLKNTKNNREVFAMFFPPDPSVATNVAFMIDELGLETTEKYDQLVLAFAVGRREFGMGAFDLTHQGRYVDALGKLNDLRSSGVMPPPADLYCAGKPPVNWYGNTPAPWMRNATKGGSLSGPQKITPKQAWLREIPHRLGNWGLRHYGRQPGRLSARIHVPPRPAEAQEGSLPHSGGILFLPGG